MEISETILLAANRSAEQKKAAFPMVLSVRYDRRIARILIQLDTGLELAFHPRAAQGLENARPADLVGAIISPSGLGIHFPRLDADIYLPALLEGFLGSKRWIAKELGKRGGAATSPKKASAARQNGALGGRPKKANDGIAA